MKTYTVKVPIVGYALVYIEAPNEEIAKEEAINHASLDEIEEWEAVKQICMGNVFMGPLNAIEVEEEE